MTTHRNTSQRDSREVRERAVRMVFEHEGDDPSEWAPITLIEQPSPSARGANKPSMLQAQAFALCQDGSSSMRPSQRSMLANSVIG